MATQQFQKTAFNTMRSFRKKQIVGLEKHLKKFGPLPGFADLTSVNEDPNNRPTVLANPFLPYKYPKMRKWATPKFSLRRQAELVKKAQISGTMDLLPPGPKKFAAEHRAERVMNSHSPAVLQQLAEMQRKAAAETTSLADLAEAKKAKKERQMEEYQSKIAELCVVLEGQQVRYEAAKAEYDAAELATFEAEGDKAVGKAQLAELLKTQRELELTYIAHLSETSGTEKHIARLERRLSATSLAVTENWTWKTPVRWAPEFVPKKVPGFELGTRLYTGKKRMFKGHLWERKRAGRMRKTAMLMRDMPARVARYKAYYKKRKPNPLKPSRYSKAPKLPY